MPDDERALSPIAQVVSDVPGIALASIGLGCTLLAIEGDRLSTLRTVSVGTDFNTAASILALAVLVGLALLYRKGGRPVRVPTPGVIALGALMSASMFVVLQQDAWEDTPAISFLGYTMFNVGEGLLLFVWVKTLFPYGARASAVVLALATIVLAALNCLIAFLKVDAAYTAVSMLPIISVVLLCYFREYARSRSDAEASAEGGSTSGGVPDQSLLVPSDRTKSGRRLFAATLMLSLACYAVVFGQIHYQWVGLQDGGTVSLIIQLGTAVGTACGGVAILALVQYFWSRRSFDFYKLFLIPTVLLALWLSSFVDETWIFLYLVLLNVTQKLVFLFIMLAPFLIESKPPYLQTWCAAFLSFSVGRAVSSLLLEGMSTNLFVASSVIPIVILFACGAVASLSGGISEYREEPADDSSDTSEPSGTTFKLQHACGALAERFQLTNREEEILLLLARGRTAQHIAETLVITQSTAKTHLRNIYAKMDVHNQQEIINLVEQTIDEQRNR